MVMPYPAASINIDKNDAGIPNATQKDNLRLKNKPSMIRISS